ncbi:MAG: hypothetical protein K5989_04815 [Lachnospiraceae bacterium]|nr:hypothetical protein [Lachnospiraceae bacterium]
MDGLIILLILLGIIVAVVLPKGVSSKKAEDRLNLEKQEPLRKYRFIFRLTPQGYYEALCDDVLKRTLHIDGKKNPSPEAVAESEAAEELKQDRKHEHPVLVARAFTGEDEGKQIINGWIAEKIRPEIIAGRLINSFLPRLLNRSEEEKKEIFGFILEPCADFAVSFLSLVGLRGSQGTENGGLFFQVALTDEYSGIIQDRDLAGILEERVQECFHASTGMGSGEGEDENSPMDRAEDLYRRMANLYQEDFRKRMHHVLSKTLIALEGMEEADRLEEPDPDDRMIEK